MKAVVFAGAGGSEVVRSEERHDPRPAEREVVVAVRFAGCNPADVQQRTGRYPAPAGAPSDVPGLEVAGEVVECGAGVTRWTPGDRVFGLVAGGGLASRVAVHETCVTRVPATLDAWTAAAVPEAFVTAHDAVVTRGQLLAGEVLLVHGAGGAVGSAAVQIGVLRDARVLGSVRSARAEEMLRELGAEPVPDADFAQRVNELTSGAGVDVVLELVGAPHFPGNLEVIATRGRIVVVGVGAGARVDVSLLRLMQRRASLHGTVLRSRSVEEKALALQAFERDVVPSLASGAIGVAIDSVYEFEHAAAALERVAAPGKSGKVLIDFGDD